MSMKQLFLSCRLLRQHRRQMKQCVPSMLGLLKEHMTDRYLSLMRLLITIVIFKCVS